ncbi:hypothetical protein JCM19039_2945 [Geomicrobium sp. JCM 19039]|nr:hypothetical protein JCM19039_2945 [Geomicrobium sp. JCM 19039]
MNGEFNFLKAPFVKENNKGKHAPLACCFVRPGDLLPLALMEIVKGSYEHEMIYMNTRCSCRK